MPNAFHPNNFQHILITCKSIKYVSFHGVTGYQNVLEIEIEMRRWFVMMGASM